MLPRVRKSCQTIRKCFPAPGSPVRPSESAFPRQEALSDHRKVLPRARKSCQTIGKCFPASGSPVRPSESASPRLEALSDHSTTINQPFPFGTVIVSPGFQVFSGWKFSIAGACKVTLAGSRPNLAQSICKDTSAS